MRLAALLLACLLLAGCRAGPRVYHDGINPGNPDNSGQTEPQRTRSAITGQLVWIGGVSFALSAAAAVASVMVPLIPSKAAWAGFAVSAMAWGGALGVAYTGHLDAYMGWVVPLAALVGGAAVAWVAADWWRRRRINDEGERLKWDAGEVRAGVALQAAVNPRVGVNRKAELNRVEKYHATQAAILGGGA